ncbi:MAG TPA: AlpA family phage regulatory protein [Sphingomicrobium sp.]|jgi:prophage regulatory protein|nr:AlpA family phage regulatory protein [Sphingomicrobium sp.]
MTHTIELPDLIAPEEVCRVATFHRSTLHRLTKDGNFPQPIRLTPHRIAYRRKEVAEWLRVRGAYDAEQQTLDVQRA